MTLDEAINRLRLDQLREIKKLIDQGEYSAVVEILKEIGYDEDDSPSSIGQKVKKLVR